MTAPRWKGHCTGCNRDRLVESRSTHAMRVLCDDCARRPHRQPSASGLDDAPRAAPAANGRVVELENAAEIKSGRVRWAWEDRVPLRSLTVVAGEPGLGKSTFTNAHLVAALTRGELDGELRGEPRDVLILSAEDDWSTVVVPRLMAAGAVLELVHRVAVHEPDGEGLFTLPGDVPRLAAAMETVAERGRRVGMIVIDPIGAFLSETTDSHKTAAVRRALAPLAKLAMDRDLVVVVVAHLNKDDSQKLLQRVSGSGAFGQAPRSVLGFARDPDDDDGEQGVRRIIVHAKSNWGRYAKSLACHIEGCDVVTDDGPADVSRLVMDGESAISVDDLHRGPQDHGNEDVEEAIGAALADGPRPSREVKAQVKTEIGCSLSTIDRAARRMHEREELSIDQGGFPRTTTWTLASAVTSLSLPPDDATTESPMNTGFPPSGGVSRVSDITYRGDDANGALATPDQEAQLARAMLLLDEEEPLVESGALNQPLRLVGGEETGR